jgi:3-methyladenine DNA glycosylase AlkD
VSVPTTRLIASEFRGSSEKDIRRLLYSEYHEERLLALFLLIDNYKKQKSVNGKKKVADFYLTHRARVNNWDLVDSSAHKILGAYCFETGKGGVLSRLAASSYHWDRRIAIVSTLEYIRQDSIEIVFNVAKTLLHDKEDLMHKATGWMLREAGKKDMSKLEKFIKVNGSSMPRTMLRYSIEKMKKTKKKEILLKTKLSCNRIIR